MNLGVADYDGLQTQISYRGNAKMFAALSYTLSKATNTTEPDGNGIGPNESNIARLGEEERGPSVRRSAASRGDHVQLQLPYNITAGTVTQLASARPFNATTGIDNNGDGANNDRPVVDGAVIGKSAFRGTGTQDVSLFVEGASRRRARDPAAAGGLQPVQPRQHPRPRADDLRRHGDGEPDVRPGRRVGTATNAIPALANIDPPRMFQRRRCVAALRASACNTPVWRAAKSRQTVVPARGNDIKPGDGSAPNRLDHGEERREFRACGTRSRISATGSSPACSGITH
jgi:hypothetical protein